MLFWIISIVLSLLIITTVIYFNIFIRYRNRIKNAWSDIDVQLKQRYDLIPNLVEVVKQYAKYESNTLEEITRKRSEYLNTTEIEQKAVSGSNVTKAMKNLFAIIENYPELLADKSFINLQNQLVSIEDSIQMARRYYNAVVRDNNIAVESFPGIVFSKFMGFHTNKFFEMDTLEKEVIMVKLKA